jgi:molybdate transport system substrate-binding protein
MCVGARAQEAKELNVAAAADLQPVMPAFQAAYEKKTGVKLKVSFASSSVLATQIVNGAPFDVFLAADFSFPEKVVAAGLAEEKEPVPYAQGTLVLWARKDSPIQPLTMEVMDDPRVTKIAIADQFHAPYGAAAYSALTWMKKLDAVKPKLVVAENIAQTAQFVVSGNDRQLCAGAVYLPEDPAVRGGDEELAQEGRGTGVFAVDAVARRAGSLEGLWASCCGVTPFRMRGWTMRLCG